MKPRLIWESGGRLRIYELEPGHSYYLGRPRQAELDKYSFVMPDKVYIIPLGGGRPYDTCIERRVVSRYHLKINVYSGCRVDIVNHGPNGAGALNETLIDGTILERGATRTLDLEPGRSVFINLTSIGPTFILSCPRGNVSTITVRSYTVTRVPTTIARSLNEAGLVAESVGHGDEVTVVLRDLREKINKIIDTNNKFINILFEWVETRESIMKNRFRLTSLLKDLIIIAQRYMYDRRYAEYVEAVENIRAQLGLKEMEKIICSAGSEAITEYKQLMYIISGQGMDPNLVIRYARRLLGILEVKSINLNYIREC